MNIVVDGLRFYHDSIFFFFFCLFFATYPPSLLNATHLQNRPGHMFGSECDLKIYVQNLGYLSRKIGDPKAPIFDVFQRLRRLTATLTSDGLKVAMHR